MPDQPARSRGPHSDLASRDVSWALVCAHPGHELRAHHFLERVRPKVFVLTDGSGGSGSSRTHYSYDLIRRAGADVIQPFGVLPDREAYAALMRADPGPFAACMERIADVLLADGIAAVAVDAAEGFNPVHDVCHWMGVAAAARAATAGATVELFELDLVGPPDGSGAGIRLRLDGEALERKIAAASAYEPLRAETDAALARFGREAFAVEFLRQAPDASLPDPSWVPDYERVGTARVEQGRYDDVLRYASHVRPVSEALLESARVFDYAADLGPADQ